MTGWMAYASCNGMDPDMWEAEPTTTHWHLRVREAVAVCRVCPVRSECAEFGLRDGHREYTILGGLLPSERIRIGLWRDIGKQPPKRPNLCRNSHDLDYYGKSSDGRCKGCARESRNRVYERARAQRDHKQEQAS